MYLLDTSLVSELRKVRSGKADCGVAPWVDRVDAAQGVPLQQWLEDCVLQAFDGRILPGDVAVARLAQSPWVSARSQAP